MRQLIRFLLSVWPIWQLLPVTTLSVVLLGVLLHASSLPRVMTPVHWVVAAPFLYFFWLLGFLALSALEIQLRFRAYEKPRHEVFGGDRPLNFAAIALPISYYRACVIQSLPLGRLFTVVPGLRKLTLLAYAPRVHIGDNTMLGGILYDPDLTHIGRNVIIGGNSTLSAHNNSFRDSGEAVYISAPIRIDDGATIGGETRIGMGVTIGQGAIVEPASNVVAFTHIPPGEVWGGNPAVFLRKRQEGAAARPTPPAPSRPATPHADARRLVASVLGIAPEEVTDDLGAANFAAWDSLAQFGLAARLHDAFGLNLSPEKVLGLRSLADVERLLDAEPAPVVGPETQSLPTNPELLPLLDPELATRLLARRELEGTDGNSATTPLRILIAASFTAEPLAPTLRLWCRPFGIDAQVEFCGYNQVQQALLAPDSPFRANPAGLNVVLVRPEDLNDLDLAPGALLDAIERFHSGGAGEPTLVVGTLPPLVSPGFAADRTRLEIARAEWRRRLAAIETVELFEFSDTIEAVGLGTAADHALEAIARAPYSARAFQAIGIGLARLARRRRVPPAKVIALDADGTLWGGVVAEDGLDGLQVGSDGPGRAFQLFQRALFELKRKGVLLTLVSRNETNDVLRVFDDHPGMVLRRTDIAAWRVDWNPKSDGLRALAEQLNLGLDAFVFIDDDPVQRLHVEANLPRVTVFPTPTDAARYAEALSRLWIFDTPRTTLEDASRTELIRLEQERQAGMRDAADLDSYLDGLGLVVELRNARDRDLPRVAQLTQKTNQFNLSLRRRTLDEIRALDDRHQAFTVSARDRFGDYGLIGVAILRHDPDDSTLVIDTFLLSCRALGRGIEQTLLSTIFDRARSLGVSRVLAPFVEGPRNQPARSFFATLGFVETDPGLLQADLSSPVPLPAHVTLETDLRVPTLQ